MKIRLLTAAMLFAASSASSQHAHQSEIPVDTGQSQFAAIAKIVTLLLSDPKTDWTQVDIASLRDHLVDMDNVTTKARVQREVDGLNVTLSISGDPVTALSIQRMVLAHSPMLQNTSGWDVIADETENGATMILQAPTQAALSQIRALGFFGLMTIGAHHQQHHLMIAAGKSPH